MLSFFGSVEREASLFGHEVAGTASSYLSEAVEGLQGAYHTASSFVSRTAEYMGATGRNLGEEGSGSCDGVTAARGIPMLGAVQAIESPAPAALAPAHHAEPRHRHQHTRAHAQVPSFIDPVRTEAAIMDTNEIELMDAGLASQGQGLGAARALAREAAHAPRHRRRIHTRL
jgi:hypothetical protein